MKTDVDLFWSEHTVNSKPMSSVSSSFADMARVFLAYPLFSKFMGLYDTGLKDKIILDYGCGAGRDLVGFLFSCMPKKVIGMDVSDKALSLSKHRLDLHGFDTSKIELFKVSDGTPVIPLDDHSIDYIHSCGVLHHVTYPRCILNEFYRVLKDDGKACVMVYNYNSIWFHLNTAIRRLKEFPDLTTVQVWNKFADSGAPIANLYKPGEFATICNDAGFGVEYAGGYFSDAELSKLEEFLNWSLQDIMPLGRGHIDFLKSLTYDSDGFPLYCGKHAGLGGVYNLCKR